jgi:hypothetical protein
MAKKELTIDEALQLLETKRAALIERGKQLPALRRAAAYAAHTGDTEARRALDKVNAEIATHESELQSVDDAIHQGQNQRLIAQARERDLADRAKAKEAIEILAAFRQAGTDLDRALAIPARLRIRRSACGVRR